MDISHFFSLIINIDQSLALLIQNYGVWIYAILFFIIFAETGLIIFPFLPGDSLLFLVGAFCAAEQMHLNYSLLGLFISAFLGNTCNYYIGKWLGVKVYEKNYRWIDQKHLQKTQIFFTKHGGKTLVLARFLPIFRTFAPFVAGISKMNSALFQLYNILGAFIWVFGFITLGYLFGNIPFIKDNLNTIVLIGFALAFLPVLMFAVSRKIKQSKN